MLQARLKCTQGHPLMLRLGHHHGCDGCGYVGTQYMCLEGCDYQMCIACYSKNCGERAHPSGAESLHGLFVRPLVLLICTAGVRSS